MHAICAGCRRSGLLTGSRPSAACGRTALRAAAPPRHPGVGGAGQVRELVARVLRSVPGRSQASATQTNGKSRTAGTKLPVPPCSGAWQHRRVVPGQWVRVHHSSRRMPGSTSLMSAAAARGYCWARKLRVLRQGRGKWSREHRKSVKHHAGHEKRCGLMRADCGPVGAPFRARGRNVRQDRALPDRRTLLPVRRSPSGLRSAPLSAVDSNSPQHSNGQTALEKCLPA